MWGPREPRPVADAPPIAIRVVPAIFATQLASVVVTVDVTLVPDVSLVPGTLLTTLLAWQCSELMFLGGSTFLREAAVALGTHKRAAPGHVGL